MGKSEKYHASIWGGKKWQCCRAPTRNAEGCEPCSEWNKTPPNSPIIKNGENNSPILGKCFHNMELLFLITNDIVCTYAIFNTHSVNSF